MENERAAGSLFSHIYQPGKRYAGDVQFITPDFMESGHFLNPKAAAMVNKISTRRFSSLDDEAKEKLARAVTEKEAEVHTIGDGDKLVFDVDRHEGNYLLVTVGPRFS